MNRFLVGAALLAFAVLAGANGAWATNITIADTIGVGSTGWWRGITTPVVFTPVNEDNEVEPGVMPTTQAWDLEAIALNGNFLSLTGGWDFINGMDGSSWPLHSDGRWSSGDVFLALGPTAPAYGAGVTWANPGEHVTSPNLFGYDYVLHLDMDSNQVWTGTYSVIALSQDSTLMLATAYEGYNGWNNGSNPWIWERGGTVLASGLQAGFTPIDPGVYRDGTPSPGVHNTATFDLSYIEEGWDSGLWVHFTEECGNDNLMGYTPVPEPLSMMMIGCVGAGMFAARKLRRRKP